MKRVQYLRYGAPEEGFWLNLRAAYDLSLPANDHDYSGVRSGSAAPARQMGSRWQG
jgi:hypothetical protein